MQEQPVSDVLVMELDGPGRNGAAPSMANDSGAGARPF